MDSPQDKKWYLVYTKPRQEQVARENLERQNYTAYLPVIWDKPAKNKKRQSVPMFPRYLFIQLDQSTDNWGPIRSTIGVISVVRFGMKAVPVPETIIKSLQHQQDENGTIEYIGHEFSQGEKIRVKEGAFQGAEGLFLAKTGGERVAVLLEIMGQPSRAVLPDNEIEPNH